MSGDGAAGPTNSLLDVAGIRVGSAQDDGLRTGVTVVLPEAPAVAACDVRGGGPGTRETEALSPDTTVTEAHAVVLSGGSALGLGAADAVAAALSAQGVGLQVGPGHPPVPIVPAAILYDLREDAAAAFAAHGPPHPGLARAALSEAQAGGLTPEGAAGAGRGAKAGRLQGGQGTSSSVLAGVAAEGLATVAALVAANPVGSVVAPGSRVFWAWMLERCVNGAWEFGGVRPEPGWTPDPAPLPSESRLGGAGERRLGAATMIGVVATDAALTQAEARRLAMMAQDGYARAARPSHSPFDGDAVFALSTGRRTLAEPRALALAALGSAAADAVARAATRGVWAAEADADGPPAWRDLPQTL
ncbi:MAG: P1 family peptidase [Pseudomonadota bacterium]